MPVLDASVLVAYLAGDDLAELARPWVVAPESGLWSPHLMDAEVGHALRRKVAAGSLPARWGARALEDLTALPVHRTPHAGLLPRAWALRKSVSFYDGLYVALAELLGEPLVTADERLARAHGHRASIELLA